MTPRTPGRGFTVPLERAAYSCRAPAKPPSSTTADSDPTSSTSSTVPGSPYHGWELSIVLPRLIIHSNRAGLEPNLPPLDSLHTTPRLPALCFPFLTQRL